jgi:hypothetical protein
MEESTNITMAWDAKLAFAGSEVIHIPMKEASVATNFTLPIFSFKKTYASKSVNMGIVKLMVITVESGNLSREKQYIAMAKASMIARIE